MMEKNKKKNCQLKQIIICSFLLALIFILVVINLNNRNNKDTTPPSINYSLNTIVYDPEADLSELLADVSAMDEEDGDVTPSLRVRTINVSDDNNSAVITYVAKDQANNIGLKKRIVEVRKTEKEADISSETEETP